MAAGLSARRALGRLAVRQPLGRRRDGQGCRPHCATRSASRSASRPTRPIATCSRATGSSAWRMSARGRSGCCSPAPARRTRTRPTRCTSPASPRRTRSTRCRRKRCWPSPITATTASALPRDGGDAEAVLAAHAKAGIDLTALAAQLQSDGAKGFVKSWHELLGAIDVQEQGPGLKRRENADDRSDRLARLAGAHRASCGDQGRASAHAVRRRSRPGGALLRRGGGPVPRLFEEPHHRRDAAAAAAAGRGARRGEAARRDVRRREDQHDRTPRRAARRAARAARRPHRGRWRRRGAGCPQGARRDGGFRHAAAQRRVHRPYRQAHPQRREYRHRRVLSRARNGLSRAAPVQRPVDDVPLRRQCRWRGFHRGDAGPGRGGDAVHRLVQDLHHAWRR